MMKKSFWVSILILGILLAVVTYPVNAQASDYDIRLRRDFGYGAGSNVRGTFTISLSGDESQVASVVFLIDGEEMATVEEAPFRFKFHTDNFGFGMHQLSAKVFLLDGSTITTRSVGLNFISPEEERGSMTTLFIGIGGALILALVIFGLVQFLVFKRKPGHTLQPGEVHQYGLLGGAICPKCGRAFPRHIWGINLGVGKFDRCEHCGQWSMTTRATPEALRAAEAAEMEAKHADQEAGTGKGQVKDALEDTRYIDDI
ncbi:MAG: hypothetical protein K0B06_05425 [Brevefilum sp.]|nr:hypothetical protein [Brevefilum sp.]